MDTMTEQDLIQSIEDDLDDRMAGMLMASKIAMDGNADDAVLTLMAVVRALYLDAPEDAKEVADAILEKCTDEYCTMAAESIVMTAKWQSVPIQYANGVKC